MIPMNISRRTAILGLTASVSIGPIHMALAHAPTDKRLVVIILRGAMDGLSAVVPYGDPGLLGLRGEIVPPSPGQPDGLLDLGGFFGLHPALTGVHSMYRANEALIVHAVAGPYRVRSHFEAQDYLESGTDHRMTSGWLNRVVAALPIATIGRPDGNALAVGVSVPLLLRGPAQVSNWAPHGFSEPAPDLYAAIAALNTDGLHALAPATINALGTNAAGLTAADILAFTPSQISALTTAAMHALTTDAIIAIPTVDIGSISTAQLAAMTHTQDLAWTTAQKAAMSAGQLAVLH